VIRGHRGFQPDLTHFAIGGLCARCQRSESIRRRTQAARTPGRAGTSRREPG
jgi:hypothetical protein